MEFYDCYYCVPRSCRFIKAASANPSIAMEPGTYYVLNIFEFSDPNLYFTQPFISESRKFFNPSPQCGSTSYVREPSNECSCACLSTSPKGDSFGRDTVENPTATWPRLQFPSTLRGENAVCVCVETACSDECPQEDCLLSAAPDHLRPPPDSL